MNHVTFDQDRILWETIDSEAVLVNMESSAYYGLNQTGTFLWECLANGQWHSGELAGELATRYDLEQAEIVKDVEHFLDELHQQDLVSIQATAVNREAVRTRQSDRPNESYEIPTVTRFGDLEKLILSGE